MAVHVTYYNALVHSDFSGYADSRNVRGVLSTQEGAAETLSVGSSAAPGSVSQSKRVALIKTTEACRLDVVASTAAATANSGWWAAGETDIRFVPANMRVSVIQP